MPEIGGHFGSVLAMVAWRALGRLDLEVAVEREVVGIGIEEFINLMILDRTIPGRLINVAQLDGCVSWGGRGTGSWIDARRESGGTHIRRKMMDPIFEHGTPPLAPPAIPS